MNAKHPEKGAAPRDSVTSGGEGGGPLDVDPRSSDPAFMVRRARSRRATVPLPTLLNWGRGEIAGAGLSAAEAEWLLEWATGEESLVLGPQEVGIRAAETYRSGIAQRRSRIPLQHITGEMGFRRLTLRAGPGVFSVRPETETLVEHAIEILNEDADASSSTTGGPVRVVDLCAGSGAIGLSIAKEVSGVHVEMVELDNRAAPYLFANLDGSAPYSPGSTVNVTIDDALTALEGQEGTFQLVATNPPYVRRADAPTQPEAKADPPIALYGGGEDGLVIPRGIVVRSFELLSPGGALVMEHGEEQGADLVAHALAAGFESAETRQDLTGRPRYLIARKGMEEQNPSETGEPTDARGTL